MSYPAPSDFAKIAELERQQNEIRDIVFFNSVHAVSQSNPFGQGRKNTALGSKLGSESWFPLESAITDINEALVATGVFDKLDVQSIANVIVGPVGTLILKTIKNISDGKIFSVTPGAGRTLEITPGGGGGDDGKGIEVASTLTLTDKDMVFMQYFKDTDKVKILTGGGGSSTLPAGTVENEHLEWDDTAKTWNAVAAMTHGATGPFATTGFHRFANDQIMLSSRLFGDGGDYQIKLNSADVLDFTRDDNGITSIQLRSQHAVDPDTTFVILQQSGTGGGAIISDTGFFQWDIGATTLFSFDSPAASQGRIKFAGTPAFDNFQIAFENDTYLTGSATPGRLNVVSSGVNIFTFQTDGASFLSTANLFFNGGFIQFSGTAPTSGQVRFANDTIGLTWRGATAFNVEMKVDTAGAFDFTRDDNQPTSLKIRSQDAVVADNILTITQQGGTGGGTLFDNPNFYQFDVGATTLLVFDEPVAGQGRIKFAGTPAFDRFQVAFETDTYFTGSGTPGRLNVVSSGTNIFAFQTTGASFLGTTTNLFFNGGYIQMLERGAKPVAVANTAQMYSKDVSTVTKMFIQFSDGTEIEIGSGGGGSSFADDVFDVHDNVTPSKIFQFSLSGLAIGTTIFDINNSIARIYTFPDITGTVAFVSGGLQSFSADIELSGLFSPATDLGTSLGLAAKRFSKIFSAKWELGTTGVPIPNIELISNNIHIEASSGNDILIEENGTLFVRFDGGDNRAKFTRDISLSSTRRIRAEVDSTEIGIMVDGYTGTLGTEGTMTAPYFEDTVYPSNAATEVDFNGNDGSIGVQHDTDAGGSADARLVFRAGGVWYFLTGFKL